MNIRNLLDVPLARATRDRIPFLHKPVPHYVVDEPWPARDRADARASCPEQTKLVPNIGVMQW